MIHVESLVVEAMTIPRDVFKTEMTVDRLDTPEPGLGSGETLSYGSRDLDTPEVSDKRES